MRSPGILAQSSFFAEKADGERRLNRDALNLPSITVDTRRQIERDDRSLSRIHGVDDRARFSFDGARKPRAKETVNEERRFFKRGKKRCDRGDRSRFSPEPSENFVVDARIADNIFGIDGAECDGAIAHAEQLARNDPSVAAVLPTAAHDHDALKSPRRALKFLDEDLGRSPARVLHEEERRHFVARLRLAIEASALLSVVQTTHGPSLADELVSLSQDRLDKHEERPWIVSIAVAH